MFLIKIYKFYFLIIIIIRVHVSSLCIVPPSVWMISADFLSLKFKKISFVLDKNA